MADLKTLSLRNPGPRYWVTKQLPDIPDAVPGPAHHCFSAAAALVFAFAFSAGLTNDTNGGHGPLKPLRIPSLSQCPSLCLEVKLER